MNVEKEARTRAEQMVAGATRDQIKHWAIEWQASEIRYQLRQETAAAERQAEAEAYRKSWEDGTKEAELLARRKLERSEEWLDTADPFAFRSAYYHEVGRAISKLGSQWREPDLAKWRALTERDKYMIVHAYPWHLAIDRDGLEWQSYVNTPAGKLTVEKFASVRQVEQERAYRKQALIDKVKLETLLEWTDKLLGSEFAMPDGSRVTWGEATVDQHQARIDMLYKNAGANIEVAARHDAALMTLAETGALCLAEAVMS